MLGYFNCVVVMFLDVQTTLIDPTSPSENVIFIVLLTQ